MVEKKSDILSAKFRAEGNVFFQKSDFLDALILYNKTICYAETKESLALGYANRSAVFMELKKYPECLQNINLAKESAYPAEKLQKLLEREENCKNAKPIDTEHTPEKFFKLSYPANSQIRFIVDGLECRQTKYGTGIFTTRDLKPGDIISIEPPAFTLLNKATSYKRCCNCFKSAMMNLLPCLMSTKLMFCSTGCRESVYKKFKDLDAVVCEYNNAQSFNYYKALVDMDETFDGRDKLIDFLKNNDLKKHKKTIFDYDWNNMTDLQQKEARFKCLLSFNDDIDCRHAVYNCSHEITQGNRLVIETTKRIARIVFKHGVTIKGKTENTKAVIEGTSVFNFSTMFKHSCQPNIEYLTPHDQVLYVARFVKAGGELTMNAIGSSKKLQTRMRRELVRISQGYLCDCFMCTNNITVDEMILNGGLGESTEFFQSVYNFSRQLAFSSWKEIFDQLNTNWDLSSLYHEYHPTNLSRNMEMLFDENQRILHAVANLMTYPCMSQFFIKE